MGEGYESVPDAESWQELDEFLCEYVDGSMDPVVREVFEEYVRETPELAEHVKCLCEARDVLIHSACACRLKADFADRLRRRLTAEQGESREVVLPDLVSHLGYLAAFTSALVVMTVAAVLLGEMLVNDEATLLAGDNRSSLENVEGIQFSSLFVPPSDRSLVASASHRFNPVAPRRLPIAPLWADADWRQTGASVRSVASAW
jgi:anti-sigma factor RsiW